MPATPYDAKGLMVSAIRDDNPVIFIDDRWLYGIEDVVPEELYGVPIGKAAVKKQGLDVTLVAVSYMSYFSLLALPELENYGIDVELIDLRSVKPFDREVLIESVKKTGRLIIADVGWKSFGISAEISAIIYEEAFKYLKSPVLRIALPDSPAPASNALEDQYYPGVHSIIHSILQMFGKEDEGRLRETLN
jgi:pyruvate dehydrogenase E1 component beta subunit